MHLMHQLESPDPVIKMVWLSTLPSPSLSGSMPRRTWRDANRLHGEMSTSDICERLRPVVESGTHVQPS